MMRALVKSVNTFRLESLEDVKEFQKELQKEATFNNYQLTDFKYSIKTIKHKDEEPEVYFLVTYTDVCEEDVKYPSYKYDNVTFGRDKA